VFASGSREYISRYEKESKVPRPFYGFLRAGQKIGNISVPPVDS
jgi:hypothetical protein